MITATQQMNALEINQLQQLIDTCNQYDGAAPRPHWRIIENRNPADYCDFLYFDHKELVGYLGLFFMPDASQQVFAFTHPHYRGEGIFGDLLKVATPQFYDLKGDVLFKSSTRKKTNTEVAEKYQMKLSAGEAVMQFQSSFTLMDTPDAGIRQATFDDLDVLANMQTICFQHNLQPTLANISDTLQAKNQQVWVIAANNQLVGKAQVHFRQDGEAFVSDVCVLPAYRRCQYGSLLMDFLTRQLQKQGVENIGLEVSENNLIAFNFFKKTGFSVKGFHDFWFTEVQYL